MRRVFTADSSLSHSSGVVNSGFRYVYTINTYLVEHYSSWVAGMMPFKVSIEIHCSSIFFFFLPIIVSVACPTGPHPPLRLARRPNRGHIGGGGWTPSCGTCL